jgi:phosphatidylserine decarboxylase
MPTKQYALIAREAHPTLAVVGACAIVAQVTLSGYVAGPLWLLLAGLIYLFRDPTQTPPSLPLAVVSPIHGVVTKLGTLHDPWLKRAAEVIIIRTGPFDIRSIYAPTEGKILEQWSHAPNPGSDDDDPPHSSAYLIRTDEKDDVVLVITRAAWGGAISFGYNPGERVGQGRRVGYANFGCTARLYLPQGSRYMVADGDHVAAGSTIVAKLVHLTRMAKSTVDAQAMSAATGDDAGS